MKTKPRSTLQIIEEQVRRWQVAGREEPRKVANVPVITVSREPGSGGKLIALGLAARLDLELFHQEIIHAVAKSAQVSARFLETLDEKGLSILDEWISSLVQERHLWPDAYLQHLMKIIGTIGAHGKAVILGRGANFVLAPDRRFSVRVVSPLDVRVRRVSRDFTVSLEQARRRITRTESERRAFVRKYFNADISNPLNYDIILNTGMLSIDACQDAIISALDRRFGPGLPLAPASTPSTATAT